MAVLMTADVPGQTTEGYDGMLAVLPSRSSRLRGSSLTWQRQMATVGA